MADEATKLKAVGDFIGNLTPRGLQSTDGQAALHTSAARLHKE